MLKVVLRPDVMAMALVTAENRPKFVAKHRPSVDPRADEVGALPEHAWAMHYGIRQDSITWDGGEYGYGDGGVDFTMDQGTVDIKSSRKHKHSWVIKCGKVRAEWYVFAYVVLPDTVFFIAKAPRSAIEPIPESHVPGVRLVRFNETPGVTEFHPQDFSLTKAD